MNTKQSRKNKMSSKEQIEGRYFEVLFEKRKELKELKNTIGSAMAQLGKEEARIAHIHAEIKLLKRKKELAFFNKQERIRVLREKSVHNGDIFSDSEVIGYKESYDKASKDLISQQELLNRASERALVLSKKIDEKFVLLREMKEEYEKIDREKTEAIIEACHLRILMSLDDPFGYQKKTSFKLTTSILVFLIWLVAYLASASIFVFITQLELSTKIALAVLISAVAGCFTALAFVIKK